jgi:hypothetical protein
MTTEQEQAEARLRRFAEGYAADVVLFNGDQARGDAGVLLAHVDALKETVRGLLELDSYRPRDGSVNADWERGILAAAFAVMGTHPFHTGMLHERLRDPVFRQEYERVRALAVSPEREKQT